MHKLIASLLLAANWSTASVIGGDAPSSLVAGSVDTAKIAADAVGPTQLLSSYTSFGKVSGGVGIITSEGAVGFGQTPPTPSIHRLNLYGTGGTYVRVKDLNGIAALLLIDGADSGWAIRSGYPASTDFSIRGQNNILTAKWATDRIGIGTDNPASKLHVSSGVLTIDGAGAGFSMPTGTLLAGVIGIGTSVPCSTCTLAVDSTTGGIWTNGSLVQGALRSCATGTQTDSDGKFSACVASDRSLKTNIVPTSFPPSMIDGLKPVLYRWKDKVVRDDRRHAGFVAQDVEKVLPEAVISAGQNLKGIDPNAILAAVVSELQQLRKRVAVLEGAKK